MIAAHADIVARVIRVPRWRTMIRLYGTTSPSKSLTPNPSNCYPGRCETIHAFLVAIALPFPQSLRWRFFGDFNRQVLFLGRRLGHRFFGDWLIVESWTVDLDSPDCAEGNLGTRTAVCS